MHDTMDFPLAAIFVLLSILLSGCTGKLQSKTVIMPDTEESSEPDKVNEDFVVNKIYKLSETGDMNVDILGWIDKNQVLGSFGSDKDRSFERVDYKFNSRRELSKVGGRVTGARLSPDGAHIAYFVNEDGTIKTKETIKLMLFDLASNQETVLEENVEGHIEFDPLTWSNNSQNVSYGIWGTDGGRPKSKDGTVVKEASISIYNINRKSTNTFQIPGWTIKEMGFGVKISDDGASALIVKYMDEEYNLVYEKIVDGQFISQYKHPIGYGYNNGNGNGYIRAFDYITDHQIVFVGLGGSLSLFNRRNATTITLLEHIDTFQLSKDHKYIAYSKDREEIYVAKLQGNNVINEKSIYKGLIALNMQWSPDDKKLLLAGMKSFVDDKANSENISKDNLPYIIEFK
jgi:hypothetical protein